MTPNLYLESGPPADPRVITVTRLLDKNTWVQGWWNHTWYNFWGCPVQKNESDLILVGQDFSMILQSGLALGSHGLLKGNIHVMLQL